jgi:hypothetical protein
MTDLIPKKDDIDALIKSYFIANNISVDNDFKKVIKYHAKNKIYLYKAMAGIVNPYTLYNNQDRFLNLSFRYRKLTVPADRYTA